MNIKKFSGPSSNETRDLYVLRAPVMEVANGLKEKNLVCIKACAQVSFMQFTSDFNASRSNEHFAFVQKVL